MNTPYSPVEPPTTVRQWSAADVAKAKSLGRHDLISRAYDAGQLSDVIASGDLAQPRAADASKQSVPMDRSQAAAYLKATTTKEIQ